MSDRKYPTLLADLRLQALRVAERQAEHHGRDNIAPVGPVDGWWAEGVGADRVHDAVDMPEPGTDDWNLWAIQLAEFDHRHLSWVCSGMPVYRIDHDTLEALVATSIERLRLCDVRWPYDTFLVHFEPPALPGLGRYAWVHTVNTADIIAAKNAEYLAHRASDLIRTRIELRDKRGIGLAAAALHLGRTETFEDYFAALGDDVNEEQAKANRDAICALVSFAMYIETQPPRRATLNLPKIVSRVERAGWELPREWIVVSAKIEGRHATTHGQGVTVGHVRHHRGHVVRGHWRMQSCGPHNSLRKPLWIKPHWRGEFEPGITKDLMTDMAQTVRVQTERGPDDA